MWPTRFSVKPSKSMGPIMSNALTYWLLTSAGSESVPPTSLLPEMRSGGKPSSPTYSTSAPSERKASTRIPMGRCFMRSVPVMTCVPGVTQR